MAADREGDIDWQGEVGRALAGLGTLRSWQADFDRGAPSQAPWDALARIHLDVLPTDESVLYQVETKRLGEVRRFDIEALLAHAILMAQTRKHTLARQRAKAAPDRQPGMGNMADPGLDAALTPEDHRERRLAWEEATLAQVLIVIQIPSLTRATVEHLLSFLNEHVVHTRMSVLITSPRGGRVAWFGGLPRSATSAIVSDGTPDPFTVSPAPTFERASSGFTFTDANQKLLKILLFAEATPHFPPRWGRVAVPIHSAEELAKAGDVALTSAYRFRQALTTEGWLHAGSNGRWIISRTKSVLRQWIAHTRLQGPAQVIPARPLWFSGHGRDPGASEALLEGLTEVARHAAHHTWAITGWAALAAHKFGTVLGPKPLEVVIDGDLPALVQDLRLVPCDDRDAVVTITRPRAPRSTFCGVLQSGGLPYVDAWQAALDGAWDPERGMEQTERIARVLFESAEGPEGPS